jgi:hypothetical protein
MKKKGKRKKKRQKHQNFNYDISIIRNFLQNKSKNTKIIINDNPSGSYLPSIISKSSSFTFERQE